MYINYIYSLTDDWRSTESPNPAAKSFKTSDQPNISGANQLSTNIHQITIQETMP